MTKAVTYPVMERFPTLQGEGAWTGHAAWFIRLGGCDVGCAWCDVKESWPVEAHPQVEVETLVKEAVDSGLSLVVSFLVNTTFCDCTTRCESHISMS